ncbi:hypothetical protein BOX15_Mlig014590g1 [Macrostomum lignano]|uniref:C2H2-type domain-containing protein n=2 Tax=Macrostomum lignano TaxID=282301 RepID=A0A267EHA1_9PLAT|nr:hypothetical protein BOX15_Mlig014590g1 [Macrostomum lignano]
MAMLADDGVCRGQAQEVIDLSNNEDSTVDGPAAPAASLAAAAAPCCEGEAALQPDDELVLLNYSMVRHRVGDIFVHTKNLQLLASGCGRELRPVASFLRDIGLALVLHHYPAARDRRDAADEDQKLPAVSHLVTPFRFRCATCPFRADTELAVLLHYQRGHLSPEGLYRCALDKFSCRDPETFRSHMRSGHRLPGLPPALPGAYQCELCVSDCATPGEFFRHACPGLGSRPLAPDAVESQPVACCLQLDSLHLFGVTEMHGRLERGTFYGKRIVMSQAAVASANANASASVSATSQNLWWQPPMRSFSAQPVRLRNYAGPDRPPFVLCELCRGAVRSFRSLAHHLRSAHGFREPPDRLEAALRSPAGRRCPGCGRRFLTRRGMALHLAWGGGASCLAESRPTCRYCGCRLADAEALCAHLRLRHPAELLDRLAKLHCPICPPAAAAGAACRLGGFPSVADLLRHLGSRHGLRSVGLRGGELHFDHRRRLSNLQRFNCLACQASFSEPQSLTKHAAVSGHRLTCRRCRRLGRPGVEFLCREAWLAHLRVAHGADMDRCPICSKRFLVGPNFVGHVIREHLRPCSVRLTRMSALH